MFSRAQVRRALRWVPGKQRLGVYRFLPFFFVLGGAMEWIMIKVRVGRETFYDVYRRKASERQYQRRLEEASETELQQSINPFMLEPTQYKEPPMISLKYYLKQTQNHCSEMDCEDQW